MGVKKENTNRNIDINPETWAKVGVMAANMNKSKKTVVSDAIEYYYKNALRVLPGMKK